MKLPASMRSVTRNWVHVLRGVVGSWGLFGRLNPPILLVGAPNSGTSIVAIAIAAHREVINRNEERVLWDPNFHRRDHTDWKGSADVTAADRRRIRGNMAYYQWASRGSVAINKHPPNALRIHYLKAIFPEALLVHLIRDPRAVVCSNYRSYRHEAERRVPFGNYVRPRDWRDHADRPILEQFSYMWERINLHAFREGRTYGDDYVQLRYEELEHRRDERLAQVWSRAGLEIAQADFARAPRLENRNHKWRRELADDQIETIERTAAEAMRTFGYAPERV